MLKKQAKKEQIEREESVRDRLREAARIQNYLGLLNNSETIRRDFLSGNKGANVSNNGKILICKLNQTSSKIE